METIRSIRKKFNLDQNPTNQSQKPIITVFTDKIRIIILSVANKTSVNKSRL